MSKRPSWGHTSRRCARCGKVGPRCIAWDGWIHAYCRTQKERRDRERRKKAKRENGRG